jgi:hypothetical protein
VLSGTWLTARQSMRWANAGQDVGFVAVLRPGAYTQAVVSLPPEISA